MNRLMMATLERAEDVNLQTGEFPMVLATDGEATDGDILSIEGAQFTDRAPLQMSHINDPTATLGSITGFRRELKGQPKRLKARGVVEIDGDGPAAEIRRDVLFMMGRGHVTGISVRWEPLEFTRRVNLPAEHPAHVPEDEPDWRKRYGYFHKRWRVLEGSIVAVQADPAAMVGRAEETEGAVSEFWTRMANEASPVHTPDPKEFETKDSFLDAWIGVRGENARSDGESVWAEHALMEHGVPKCIAKELTEERSEETEQADDVKLSATSGDRVETKEELDDATRRAVAAARLRETITELGLTGEDLRELEDELHQLAEPDPYEGLSDEVRSKLEQYEQLEARLAALEEGRVSDAPSPSLSTDGRFTMDRAFDYIDAGLKKAEAKALAILRASIAAKQGRVIEGMSPSDRIRAEAQALFDEYREQIESEEGDVLSSVDLAPSVEKFQEILDRIRERTLRVIDVAGKQHRAALDEALVRSNERSSRVLRAASDGYDAAEKALRQE